MKSHNIDVLVLGLGNPLMGDDGLGVLVASELQKAEWREGVVVLDAGTSGITYLGEVCQSLNLIVIDAVRAGGSPGTIYRFVLDAGGDGRRDDQYSHGFSVTSIVALARTMTGLPSKVVVFRVEPLAMDLSAGVSDAVKKAVPRVIDAVRTEIGRLRSTVADK
jgi:hydrogenase maturation protease